MITLFLGDDTQKSRSVFAAEKMSVAQKGIHIFDVNKNTLNEVASWMGESQGLFVKAHAFFAENILKQKEIKQILPLFEKSKDQHIVIWEQEYDARIAKKIYPSARIVESKFPDSVFTFLDGFVPGNKQKTIDALANLSTHIDEHVFLYMLSVRLRDLILISGNKPPSKKMADWQIARLKNQARSWDAKKLLAVYDGLYRIEMYSKTGKNYYKIPEALDILIAFYL